MTQYDKIRRMSPEDLAVFISTLVSETEDKMLDTLYAYGVQVSLVRPAPEIRYADNLAMLLQEVDDAYS